MNIALACKTKDLEGEVLACLPSEHFTVSCTNFSDLLRNGQHNPLVILDAAILDDVRLIELHEFCSVSRQAQTFVIVVSNVVLDPKDILRIYTANVVDVVSGPDVSLLLQVKIDRYSQYLRELEKRALTHQYTQQQNELLEFHATHDSLTGVYNHLYFQETMIDEFVVCNERDSELGLLMFDIDFFKEVNDSYGHQVGDIVLKEFAELALGLIPEDATWCRYGGEEFMLILPELSKDEISEVAKTIRLATEKFVFCTDRSSLKITVSIGGTMVTSEVTKVATLIEQADHALYQAKAAGRNAQVWYVGYCQDGRNLGSPDHFACVRDRLRATLEKTRASALASFEAMVHSQTRDYLTLQARNKLALQMVNLLCKRLNLPRNVSQSFRRAFKLHDLLRLFISDSTLEKSGSLSEAEMLAIEDQPLMLKQLTDLFDFFADERMILRYHHEYFDGSGYPEGLDGQDIPMGARLFTVVDAYVAMMVPSYERPLKNKDEVISEFQRLSGAQFDPFIVSLLIDIVSKDGFVDIIKEQLSEGSIDERHGG